jgi:hypothetical protein
MAERKKIGMSSTVRPKEVAGNEHIYRTILRSDARMARSFNGACVPARGTQTLIR